MEAVTIDNKELYIHNSIADMAEYFDADQLHNLEYIMRKNLKGKNIVSESTELSTWLDDNEHVIKIFLASKKLEGCKDSTLIQYKLSACQFFTQVQKNYRDVTKDDVKLYIAYRMKAVKQTTLLNTKRNLSSFFSWLHNEGYITQNPITKGGIRVDEIENIHLTLEEEVKVRDVQKSIRDQALIDFLFSTGVRVGELVSLNISDIDFSTSTVTFRGEKGNRKFRTVILDARAKSHLCDYLELRDDCNPALFVTDRIYAGTPRRLSSEAIEKITKTVGYKAGLKKKLTVHVFRRTLATKLADSGCPLEVIQGLLGHCNAVTTQRYIAKNPNRIIRDAIRYF